MPNPEWRADEYGNERAALYLGGLYVGHIVAWGRHGDHAGQWRAWFMSDPDGVHLSWHSDPVDARMAVEAALSEAIR